MPSWRKRPARAHTRVSAPLTAGYGGFIMKEHPLTNRGMPLPQT
jgi:hypothetical protein